MERKRFDLFHLFGILLSRSLQAQMTAQCQDAVYIISVQTEADLLDA